MNSISKSVISTIALLVTLTNCTNKPAPDLSVDYTDTPKPTSTSTVSPPDTPIPTSTPVITTAVLEETTSLDGFWIAVITLTTQERDRRLDFRILNKSTDKEWIVEQKEWNELQTPSVWIPFPYVFQWSQDNYHLYYSYLPNFNDGCFGYFRPGGYDLKQLDLNTGEIVTLRNGKSTWMALSPDETQLALIETFGGNVSILEIEDGETHTFNLPSIENEAKYTTDTSDLYWAPDGESLIYTHYVGACDLLTPIVQIIQLFPKTSQQNVLVDSIEEGYIPIEWNTQDKILLHDGEGNRWLLNPATKEITPAKQ